MSHSVPSASEKEKTALLVASLSCKEQAELLAQALLREFMHRRGLQATLKAFDEENPRDERTISSRALMRQLLNIPVDGRPSRLRPSVSVASGKALPPTFMEELCSYRLTKRGYTHPEIKIGDEKSDDEADPSDVELEALHSAVESHRIAKATCEQKLRHYEEMLVEEENYQRRKEAHKEKRQRQQKHQKDKRGRRGKEEDKHRRRKSQDNDCDNDEESGEEDDGNDSASNTDGSGEGEDEDKFGNDPLSRALERHFSGSLSLTPKGTHRRGGSMDPGSLTGAAGTGWQPPGVSSANVAVVGETLGIPHHPSHHPQPSSRSFSWTPTTAAAAANDNDDDSFDPFGSGASSQQALMARLRAESRHWVASAGRGSNPDDASNHNTPKKAEKMSGIAIGRPSPLATLSNVPRGMTMNAGGSEGPSVRLGGSSSVASSGGLGVLGVSSGNTRLTAAPAGYNPNAVAAMACGAPGASPLPASEGITTAPAGLERPAVTPYSHGFPPPPSSALAPSIMVKHTDAAARRDTATPSPAPSPTFDLGGINAARNSSTVSGSTQSYDCAAALRSTTMTGSSGNTNHNTSGPSIGRTAHAGADVGSPSPHNASFGGSAAAGENGGTPSSFYTSSRSANNSGGGNNGLRHGIGFRTSVSAEGTQSGVVAAEGEGGRHNRKERRVKLLIDD